MHGLTVIHPIHLQLRQGHAEPCTTTLTGLDGFQLCSAVLKHPVIAADRRTRDRQPMHRCQLEHGLHALEACLHQAVDSKPPQLVNAKPTALRSKFLAGNVSSQECL